MPFGSCSFVGNLLQAKFQVKILILVGIAADHISLAYPDTSFDRAKRWIIAQLARGPKKLCHPNWQV
jgi:hypothetical protein